MRSVWFLLRRYLFPHEGSLLTMALWVSVFGVALGIMQLMLVLSVMSGFLDLFQKNYTQISSELVVIPQQRREVQDSFKADLLSVKGVAAVTPFGLGQAMIIKGGVGGATLEGIDVETSGSVTPWKQIWVQGPDWNLQKKNSYWIWLGVQLAQKLDVKVGDTVNVLVPSQRGRKVIPFVVTAVTKFGIYEHDLRYARISLDVLKEIFRTYFVEPMYKCRLSEGADLNSVAAAVNAKFGREVETRKWNEIHQNIFLAVEHQKKLLFLILEIIVALAAMNVVNLLMMSSHHRKRDVAILRAMGMRLWKVVTFFVAQGAAVGAVGVFFGVVGGTLLCHLVERFQPAILSEQIYNVNRLPIRIVVGDVLIVCVAGFIVCMVFSLIPALGATLTRPVTVLRDE